MCHDQPTYKIPVRKPRTKKAMKQNITSSQPEPTKRDNSLLETTLNISLPCDLLSSSRLTRSKTALLRQQELASPPEPPAKKRRIIKKDEPCTPDKFPSVLEVAAVSRSKAKSSSPNQPFVECTTTPSQVECLNTSGFVLVSIPTVNFILFSFLSEPPHASAPRPTVWLVLTATPRETILWLCLFSFPHWTAKVRFFKCNVFDTVSRKLDEAKNSN